MGRFLILCLMSVVSFSAYSQVGLLDEIIFGNIQSEKKHNFATNATEVIKGGLNESARLFLPVEGERVEGGNITFKMKVDSEKQNYFTARFWGSDSGNSNILILFCEGKQIGYRHLGDYDMLDIANDEAPFPGRFTYTTLPLPLQMTQGKKEIELSIRSTGRIARYGNTFDQYQKVMTEPAKALYKGYTHTEKCFIPARREKQGVMPSPVVRIAPGIEVMEQVKVHVNRELKKFMAKDRLDQEELWVLSYAYNEPWTIVYHDRKVAEKTIETTDRYYVRYSQDPKSVYNDSWLTVGPLCLALNSFVPEVREVLDEKMENGRTRRDNWTQMCVECLDYAKTHRRQYTNQSLIVDLNLYCVNRFLSVIAPEKALPAYQTLKYLYESMGIVPWLGSETSEGPSKPLGDNYFQLSAKGLSKELGFVGGYGEILHWMLRVYEITGVCGETDSRDPLIRAQLLKVLKARGYFRYPSVDEDGNKAMLAEAVIGWRDHGKYPGTILYGEKGLDKEGDPLMTAASTLDPIAVAYAQQMLDDNQFFHVVREKMKDSSLNSTYTLLRLPGEYELIAKQPRREDKLPMSSGMPDALFADEEVGAMALKNGEEILYASLYWRANYAINYLARVHYITPEIDRIATIYEDIKFTPSGYTYKRPERTNLFFSDARHFYPEVKSAHTGEELPIAKIPEGIRYEPGWENVYAGRGEFYSLRYGKYLIGMNCTQNKDFVLNIPTAKKVVSFPAKEIVKESSVIVKPMSTVVFIIVE